MIDIEAIKEINREAKKSIRKDSDGEIMNKPRALFIYVFLMYLLPFSLAYLVIYFDISLKDNRSFIFNGIAIFVGLFFSLLLSIGSKLRTERNESNMDENHFERYKNNITQIAYIIIYTIKIGIYIFLFIFLDSIFSSFKPDLISIYSMAIVAFLLVRFIASIFFMLQRFFYTSRDEIRNIFYKHTQETEEK